MRALILIPWAIPTAVPSQMWAYMLQPNRTGFFDALLWHLGFGNGEIHFFRTRPGSCLR
jgi:trehalose/maltose transport system permease protein